MRARHSLLVVCVRPPGLAPTPEMLVCEPTAICSAAVLFFLFSCRMCIIHVVAVVVVVVSAKQFLTIYFFFSQCKRVHNPYLPALFLLPHSLARAKKKKHAFLSLSSPSHPHVHTAQIAFLHTVTVASIIFVFVFIESAHNKLFCFYNFASRQKNIRSTN
jgi:hypothetical protein